MKRSSLRLFDPRPAYDGSMVGTLLEHYRRKGSGAANFKDLSVYFDRIQDWLFDGDAVIDVEDAVLRFLARAGHQQAELLGDVLGWADQLGLVHSHGSGRDLVWRRAGDRVTFAPLRNESVDLRTYVPPDRSRSIGCIAAGEAKRRDKIGDDHHDLALRSFKEALSQTPADTFLPLALRAVDLPPVDTVGDLLHSIDGFAHAIRSWRMVEIQWHAHQLRVQGAVEQLGHPTSPPELNDFH